LLLQTGREQGLEGREDIRKRFQHLAIEDAGHGDEVHGFRQQAKGDGRGVVEIRIPVFPGLIENGLQP
jgi:hypothetical protein